MEYFNLNHLRYFYTVAKEGSYTKAAQILHIQQPALSKTVKTLEEDLGAKLFYKKGRGIGLTDQGEYIFSQCHDIFASVARLSSLGKDEDLPLKETRTIACPDILATFFLPELIKELREEFPQIRPVLNCSRAEDSLNLLREGNGSLGLFFHMPKLSKDLTLLRKFPLPFKFVIKSEEYYSPRVRSSFIGSREIDSRSSHKFPTLEKWREVCPEAQIKISTNSLLSHKEMVLNGMGVSILPEFLIREELKEGRVKELLEEEFIFDLKVIGKKGSKRTAYERSFLKKLTFLLDRTEI